MNSTSTTATTMSPASTSITTRPAGLVWSAILGGLFVGLLFYWIAFSLGIVVGGHSLKAISADELDGMGMASAIWIIACNVIGCFAAGFVAARTSRYLSLRTGMVHALTACSLFFLAMSVYLGIGMGAAGSGITNLSKLAGGSAESIVKSPQIQGVMEDSLSAYDLKADPKTVVAGVAARLLRGSPESAKNYLASQSNLSREEIDTGFADIQSSFNRAVTEIKNKASNAVAATGWLLFATTLLGTLAAIGGAAAAMKANARRPLDLSVGATSTTTQRSTSSAYA